MKDKRIAIIGCGNLGESILNGLLDKGIDPSNIIATKRDLTSIKHHRNKGVVLTSDNSEAIKNSDIILVALKPYNIIQVLEELEFNSNHILVSLASGVSIDEIEKVIDHSVQVYRAMPNTAADVNESLTCISTNSHDEESKEIVLKCFNSIGETIVIDETLMDSATVLGACGIAYVLRFIRAMIQGGIQIGFDAKTATEIVNQTVKGAAQLLIENENHPESEIDKVTTPKGCTIAGLNEMEHNGFSSALIKGIVTSHNKIEK